MPGFTQSPQSPPVAVKPENRDNSNQTAPHTTRCVLGVCRHIRVADVGEHFTETRDKRKWRFRVRCREGCVNRRFVGHYKLLINQYCSASPITLPISREILCSEQIAVCKYR